MVTLCWTSFLFLCGSPVGLPMVKLPAGIKTNSIPRELVKAFSKAKAGRPRRRLDIRINENRMDNLDDLPRVLSIIMPLFPTNELMCLEIPDLDTGVEINPNLP